jgi:ankyrin repeat protein
VHRTPLMVAAQRGDSVTVKRLLNAGASPTDADRRGSTALHCAAASGREGVLLSILAAGGDPSDRDGLGRTPLLVACESSSPHCVRRLLRCTPPAARKLRHSDGSTPLHGALLRGDLALARTLLDVGNDHCDVVWADVASTPLQLLYRIPLSGQVLRRQGATDAFVTESRGGVRWGQPHPLHAVDAVWELRWEASWTRRRPAVVVACWV